MSHFTVLVVGPDWEEQLAPFNEQDGSGMYDEFSLAVEKGKEGEAINAEIKSWKKTDEPEILKDRERYKGYSQSTWMSRYFGYVQDEEGNWGYKFNPQARWDWYSMGGRWTGFFKLKEGKKGAIGEPGLLTERGKEGWVDQALKGDIDWEGTKGGKAQAEKQWKDWQKAFDEGKASMPDYKHGIHEGDTKEKFIERFMDRDYVTFAVLINGEWYEKGNMGWCGVVSNEQPEVEWGKQWYKLVDSLSPKALLTLVDAHI